jgi:8-oxo-dGTP pyrophosphatase MutT (NUDIX family)
MNTTSQLRSLANVNLCSIFSCGTRTFTTDKSKVIRDACSIVVLRDRMTNPRVLMGQRGSGAAFMPNKFVFPGGAVDFTDAIVPCVGDLPSLCGERLSQESNIDAKTLALSAIRELFEETGQILGQKATEKEINDLFSSSKQSIPKGWQTFFSQGYVPNVSDLTFIFRAVTPLGRPRRFDARFFFLEADKLATTNLDDFSLSDDELDHLQWIPLDEVTGYDLPFITKVVLAEIKNKLPKNRNQPKDVAVISPDFLPFFRDGDDVSKFSNVLHSGARDLSEFKL